MLSEISQHRRRSRGSSVDGMKESSLKTGRGKSGAPRWNQNKREEINDTMLG